MVGHRRERSINGRNETGISKHLLSTTERRERWGGERTWLPKRREGTAKRPREKRWSKTNKGGMKQEAPVSFAKLLLPEKKTTPPKRTSPFRVQEITQGKGRGPRKGMSRGSSGREKPQQKGRMDHRTTRRKPSRAGQLLLFFAFKRRGEQDQKLRATSRFRPGKKKMVPVKKKRQSRTSRHISGNDAPQPLSLLVYMEEPQTSFRPSVDKKNKKGPLSGEVWKKVRG